MAGDDPSQPGCTKFGDYQANFARHAYPGQKVGPAARADAKAILCVAARLNPLPIFAKERAGGQTGLR